MGKLNEIFNSILKPCNKIKSRQNYLERRKIELENELEQLKKHCSELEKNKKQINSIQNTVAEFDQVDLTNIDPDELVHQDTIDSLLKRIPDGWLLYEAGQTPLNSTWACQLIEFESMITEDEQDTPKIVMVFSDQKKTFKEALKDCLIKIENEEFVDDI